MESRWTCTTLESQRDGLLELFQFFRQSKIALRGHTWASHAYSYSFEFLNWKVTSASRENDINQRHTALEEVQAEWASGLKKC